MPDEAKKWPICMFCKERPAWMTGDVPVCHQCVPTLLKITEDLEWDSARARFAETELVQHIGPELEAGRVPPRIVGVSAYTRGWRDCRDWMAGKIQAPPFKGD